MRINKFVAQATGLSRRGTDQAIQAGQVTINGRPAVVGDRVDPGDRVTLDGQPLDIAERCVVMLNKPVGYVCSRRGQGSHTVYELLPAEYHGLKPVGRLDKDSSGLLLLTNDGDLANRLTHPRYSKAKVYEVVLDQPLQPAHQRVISTQGVQLPDGLSQFKLTQPGTAATRWQATMREGRNRQIRRTFAALGYQVTALHRTRFGDYQLDDLQPGRYKLTVPTHTK